MPFRQNYQKALPRIFAAIRSHGAREGGPVALSELRASLSGAMDADSIETVLQLMVQDGLLQPARSDGTVTLTLAGLRQLRRPTQQ
jgi:hypothetical protein